MKWNVLLIVVAVVCMSCHGNDQYGCGPSELLGSLMMMHEMQMMSNRYIINGTIVDQEGQLLNNVRMNIETYNYMENQRKSKTVIFNGSYTIDESKTSSVNLSVYCDGYNTEHVGIGKNMPDVIKKGNVYRCDNKAIVLWKINNPQRLIELSFALTEDLAGVKEGVSAESIWMELEQDDGGPRSSVKIPRIEVSGEKERKNIIYAQVEKIERGGNDYRLSPEDDNDNTYGKITIHIIGDEGNGFVRAEGDSSKWQNASDPESGHRKLQEDRCKWLAGSAPESGYKQQIEITADERKIKGISVLYFYCKLGEYYGKGAVRTVRYVNIRGKADEYGLGLLVKMELFMQPIPGERDLEQTW